MAVIAALAVIAVTSASLWIILSSPEDGFPGTPMIMDHPSLVAAYQSGKPTLIFFSTITCPTCVVQEQALEEVLPGYASSINYVHLMLTSELQQVFVDWSVLKVPTTVFVGKDGVIYQRYDGQYISADAIVQILERIK